MGEAKRRKQAGMGPREKKVKPVSKVEYNSSNVALAAFLTMTAMHAKRSPFHKMWLG